MINYKNLNQKVTSNETKHVLVENEWNELSKNAKAISRKGWTKDLINKYSIIDGSKCFNSRILQNYFVFVPAKQFIKCFSGTTRMKI